MAFTNVIELEYCIFSLYATPRCYSITHREDEMIIALGATAEGKEVSVA
jgi:hypothetical protein